MFKKVALAALVAAIASTGAHAGTFVLTNAFTVSATFNPTCSVVNSRNLDFGTIGSTLTAIASSSAYAQVDITCSQGLSYNVVLTSANPVGDTLNTGFNMAGPTNKMAYKLRANSIGGPYFDTGGVQVAANGVGGAGAIPLYLYGEIQAQAPLSGSWGPSGSTTNYSDTVQVTINF